LTTSPLNPRPVGQIIRAMIVVAGSSATAMLIGLAKNVLAAFYFGTSSGMDAYFIALQLPEMVIQLSRTGAFNFIPVFAAERERSVPDAWRIAGRMLTYWLSLLLLILLVAIVAAPALMPLLAPGFSAEQRHLTLELTRGLFFVSAIFGTSRILSVVLQAHKRFFMIGLADVGMQLSSLVFLVVFHEMGVEALVGGQILGSSLHLAVVLVSLLPYRRLLRPRLDIGSGTVHRLIRLNAPVYVGDVGNKVNQFVIRALSSLLPTGAVSSLQYAYYPVEGINRMLASQFIAAFFPFLSIQFAKKDQQEARQSFVRAISAITVVFLPIAALIWILSEPMIILLFERGRFDQSSREMTSSALRLYAPALFALALNELLGSASHARQDTVTPMKAGLFRVATNVLLCLALTPLLGHRGLALATTVSLYLKLFALLWLSREILDRVEWRLTFRDLFKVFMAVGVAFLGMLLLLELAYPRAWIEDHALRSMVAIGLLGLVSYLICLRLFAPSQFSLYLGIVRRMNPWSSRRRSFEGAASDLARAGATAEGEES